MQLVEHDVAQIGEEALGVRRRRSAAPAARASSAGCPAASSFWRWRLCGGVSPVRVSMRDRRGPSRRPACRDCARCRRPAPSAARCRACGCRDAPRRACAWPRRRDRPAPAGSRPASCRRRSARSAAPSGRPAPCASSSSWCGARRPAARGEPAQERFGQERRRRRGGWSAHEDRSRGTDRQAQSGTPSGIWQRAMTISRAPGAATIRPSTGCSRVRPDRRRARAQTMCRPAARTTSAGHNAAECA